MSLRSTVGTLCVGGFVLVGCVGDDGVVALDSGAPDVTAGGDSSTDGSTGKDAAPTDAGPDDADPGDAGIITDGGGDPDPDGGVLVDSGADAGTCGPPSGTGPSIGSNCSSLLSFYGGGTVQPGTYNLTNFTVLATAQYCGTYVPGTYYGRLVITASNGNFRFDERLGRSNIINLFPNKSFDVTVFNNSLKVVQTCGTTVTPASWGYTATTTATDAGTKNVIFYTRTSGTATVRYRWVQE